MTRPDSARIGEAMSANPRPESAESDARCGCVGYTIRTDYGTGIEYDVDRSMCVVHGDAPEDDAAPDTEAMIDRIQDILVSYDEDGRLFGTSGAGSLFLAEFLVAHGVTPRGEGCDCAELCSMGPTCPGGSLAGLPDSGCWRTRVTAPGGAAGSEGK